MGPPVSFTNKTDCHDITEILLKVEISHLKKNCIIFFLFQDQDFFQHLEMYMRSEHPPLCGRDHITFRSYYFPIKVYK